jgi:hypothetical protein
VVFDDLSAAGAVVGRAAVGGAAELGDRDRLALRDQCANALLVDVGDLFRAVASTDTMSNGVQSTPSNGIEA